MYQFGWRVGLVRLLLNSQAPGWAAKISPAHRGQFDAVWSRPMANFSHDWIDAYEQTPLSDVPLARPGLLGNQPLIVISHGVNSDYLGESFQQTWPEAQAQWTALSRSGVNRIATGNTHMIAQENPALVAGYVRFYCSASARPQRAMTASTVDLEESGKLIPSADPCGRL